MAPVQTHIIVQRLLALSLALIPRVRQPPIALQQDCRAEILLTVPPVARTRGAAASTEDALVEAVEFLAVCGGLAVLLAVGRFGVALEIGFDRFILFIEVGEIGDEVFDHIRVWKGIDAGLFGRVGRDTACERRLIGGLTDGGRVEEGVHRHARVLTPSIFMAQLPQMPSRQLRRNVRVGSTSFLIRIKASSIMGPVLFKSRV